MRKWRAKPEGPGRDCAAAAGGGLGTGRSGPRAAPVSVLRPAAGRLVPVALPGAGSSRGAGKHPGASGLPQRPAPRGAPLLSLGLAGSAWSRRAARSALPPGPAAARPPRQPLRGVNGRPAALLPSALWSRERGDTAVLQRDQWRERAGDAPAAFAARSPVRGGRGSRPAVTRCSQVRALQVTQQFQG